MSPLTSSSPISCVELCKHSARPPGSGVRATPPQPLLPARGTDRWPHRPPVQKDTGQTARGLGVTIGAAGLGPQQSPAGRQPGANARSPPGSQAPTTCFRPGRLPPDELCHRVMSQTRLREGQSVHSQPAVGKWQTQETMALTQTAAPEAVGATALTLLPPPPSLPLTPDPRTQLTAPGATALTLIPPPSLPLTPADPVGVGQHLGSRAGAGCPERPRPRPLPSLSAHSWPCAFFGNRGVPSSLSAITCVGTGQGETDDSADVWPMAGAPQNSKAMGFSARPGRGVIWPLPGPQAERKGSCFGRPCCWAAGRGCHPT